MKTIEILVSPKGEPQVQTKGFTGASCREASKFIEAALGQRQHEQLTSEFYATNPQTQRENESTS